MSLSSGMSLSAGEDSPEEAGGSREMLTFRLDANTFGIRVLNVREVLDCKQIARVPNAPSTLLGMIDVRGIGVPVIDLKHKLRMGVQAGAGQTPDSRIIVLDFERQGARQTVAVVADAVHEVIELGDEEIERPPSFGEAWNSRFMTGFGRRDARFMTLLDIPSLFETDDFDFTT